MYAFFHVASRSLRKLPLDEVSTYDFVICSTQTLLSLQQRSRATKLTQRKHGLDGRHFSSIYRVLLLAKLIRFETLFLSRSIFTLSRTRSSLSSNILLIRTIYNDQLRDDKRLLSRISCTDSIALSFSALLLARSEEKLFFLPGIHNRRFMGSWFEVIAGGTYKNKRKQGVKFLYIDAVRYMGPNIIISTRLQM